MLLPSRQQNINIVLSKLRLPPVELINAMLTYDESILKPSVCDLLIPILPNVSEISQVDAYDGDNLNLADCDQFVLLCSGIPGYAERLKTITFKVTYKEDVENLITNIDCFFNVFDFISNNKNFHRWLELLLAYGNYLNGSSSRGGAYGFRLDILAKVSEVKSTDGKRNLLLYIVEYIYDVLKQEDLMNITSYLEMFDARIYFYLNYLVSMQGITDSFRELTARFKEVTYLYELVTKDDAGLEEEDTSIQFFASFYEDAKNSMSTIDAKIKGIEEKYEGIVKHLGDNPKDLSMEVLIDAFKKFNKDIGVDLKYFMI